MNHAALDKNRQISCAPFCTRCHVRNNLMKRKCLMWWNRALSAEHLKKKLEKRE